MQQLVERDRFPLVHRAGVGFVPFADADGIDDDVMVFSLGVRGDGSEVVLFDYAHAAAFHLLEKAAGFDRAHEEHDLQRLDVGAGGDHVYRHGDAREVAVPELGDDVFGLFAGGPVGDLLGELVAFAELLADDLDDIFGVAVVFGEDERLWYFGPAGKDFAEKLVSVGADDGADLIRGNDVAVELVGVIFKLFVQLLPADGAGCPVAPVHVVAGIDLGAAFGDLGLDPVDVVIHVDAIGHRLFVAVFHDQVLIEKAEGLLIGRGGKADDMGVEIFQHLAPEMIDRPVAFIGDDDVEGLDGDRRVVLDGLHVFENLLQTLDGFFFVLLGQVFSLEHGIEALDGADANPGRGVERVGGQALDDILLAEFEVVVGRDVLLKFFESLSPQVAPIHQKEHAPGAGELDQAIAQDDGEERLAGAGRHLHERARPVLA